MLDKIKILNRILEKYDIDSGIQLGFKGDKTVVEVAGIRYLGNTLEEAFLRAIDDVENEIIEGINYYKGLEEDYRRDRDAMGIGSW